MSKHTDREKLQALLDGKVLAEIHSIGQNGYGVYLDKETAQLRFTSDNNDIVDNTSPYGVRANLGGTSIADYEIREEPKWYDNIPEQGVLCRVWDKYEHNSILMIVLSYSSDKEWPFRVEGNGYKNAEPVQLADLEPYILKGA